MHPSISNRARDVHGRIDRFVDGTRPGADAHAQGPVLGESENSKLTDPFGASGSTTDDSNADSGSDFSLRNDDALGLGRLQFRSSSMDHHSQEKRMDVHEMTHRFANRGQGRRASHWLNWQVKRD